MAGACAQTSSPSSPESPGLLYQIRQHALAELASMPNFVCVDSIERSLWVPHDQQFRPLDRIHLEVTRVDGSDRFAWLGNSVFQSRNPVAMIGYGASMGGEFSDTRALIFKNTPTKISYAGRVTMDGLPALRYQYDDPQRALGVSNRDQFAFTAARGSFWVDPETLDLLQIDIEGYDIPSKVAVRSTSDSTKYWRVLIGSRTVLLPHGSEFRLMEEDGVLSRNLSVFSNCREYAAESAVTFDSSPELLPPLHPDENPHVQPGLQLQLVLDKNLDAGKAVVGDAVHAHVLQGAGDVPRGARVYGRVTRIINFDDRIPLPSPAHSPGTPKWGQHSGEVLIQIELLKIEYRHSSAPFVARLIDLESRPGKRAAGIRSFGYVDDGAIVKYDPPGTASVYVSKEHPVLERDLIMQWATTDSPAVHTNDRETR
jgi:hypothetical protein